ncbi:hypothetical protein GCM10025855_15880 [Shewanella glacialipiscicola]|uniref:Uncharacterized protein n=1 Tax=Shewanella glacialipiscicola TaxID=614069 RepID=A0ABQ6J429_9GAMM|nr:hypothetical protein GCM10025855_15880 [Shewanella glacialipiscicola]
MYSYAAKKTLDDNNVSMMKNGFRRYFVVNNENTKLSAKVKNSGIVAIKMGSTSVCFSKPFLMMPNNGILKIQTKYNAMIKVN